MSYDYDLFVIGAGSGGVRASRLASQFGAKVGLAEESRVGGTCVIRGCVPKKMFVYASEFAHAFDDAKGYGWKSERPDFDWSLLVAQKDREIDRLNGLYLQNLDKAGVEVIQSRAILKDAHTVHLVAENRDVTADKILVTVGGTPVRDTSIEGNELGITSNEAFHLERLPDRMVIAGGGYIAIEFAFIFAGLGVDVTLVYRGGRLLRHFDHDISDRVHVEIENKGIRLITDTIFEKIEEKDGEKLVHLANGDLLHTDEVFWAIGRRPKTDELGLKEAGVDTDPNGAIKTDEQHRTSQENIFALGDVTDRVNLTPVAIREGVAFAETHYNNNPTTMEYDCSPKAVFSQPPVGSVGLTEAEARAEHGEVDVYKADFRPMRHILANNPERMLIKLVVHPETDKVLGCHIVGDDAPEIIQPVAIALKAGLTKAQFDATCALHPTAAEELVLMRTKVVD